MSDIQIITGISILVSGAVQLDGGLSCYQWQIVVYLAWFSSLTHLAGLTLLRNYLYNRPAERTWRLCSMAVLIIMLIFAFVPTANYKWAPDQNAKQRGEPALADYAICYLRPVQYSTKMGNMTTISTSQGSVMSVTVSIVLIVVGFISRLFKLHQNLSLRVDEQIRGRLSDFIRRFLRKFYICCDVRNEPRSLKRTLLYRPLLAFFLTARLFLDLWASMLSEVSPSISLVITIFLLDYQVSDANVGVMAPDEFCLGRVPAVRHAGAIPRRRKRRMEFWASNVGRITCHSSGDYDRVSLSR